MTEQQQKVHDVLQASELESAQVLLSIRDKLSDESIQFLADFLFAGNEEQQQELVQHRLKEFELDIQELTALKQQANTSYTILEHTVVDEQEHKDADDDLEASLRDL